MALGEMWAYFSSSSTKGLLVCLECRLSITMEFVGEIDCDEVMNGGWRLMRGWVEVLWDKGRYSFVDDVRNIVCLG